MSYALKEIFLTLQGEGVHAGRRAVFTRFAGCNLWNGRPEDREKGLGACAKWCDTDFFKGTKTTANKLAFVMNELWGPHRDRFCVLTGGEPGLQFDDDLGQELRKKHNWDIAIETNGTIDNPFMLMWAEHICLSPKRGGKVLDDYWTNCDELKVVLPGHANFEEGWSDQELHWMASKVKPETVLYVQPQDPLLSPATEDTVLHTLRKTASQLIPPQDPRGQSEYDRNVKRCIDFVLANPQWRLTQQTHKMVGLR